MGCGCTDLHAQPVDDRPSLGERVRARVVSPLAVWIAGSCAAIVWAALIEGEAGAFQVYSTVALVVSIVAACALAWAWWHWGTVESGLAARIGGVWTLILDEEVPGIIRALGGLAVVMGLCCVWLDAALPGGPLNPVPIQAPNAASSPGGTP